MIYAIAIIILLGILIFIHEFGHFYVAKLCGMKVEVFSIGMGKKILSFKKGETEYTISIFPFGGYVKILGQDPREKISDEEIHRSFNKKPLWQRTAVVLAGPLANALLAVIIFSVIFVKGVESPAPVISLVRANTPAAQAGFRSGDQIVSITDSEGRLTKINELSALSRYLKDKDGKNLTFEVINLHNDQAGTPSKKISYAPSTGSSVDYSTGITRVQGMIDGAEYQRPAALVSTTPGTWSESLNLPKLIFVENIKFNNEELIKVNHYDQLSSLWAQHVKKDSGSLYIEYKTMKENFEGVGEKILNKTIEWNSAEKAPPQAIQAAGFFSTQLMISSVVEDTPAQKLGLMAGDRITHVDNQAILSFDHFKTQIQVLAQTKESFEIRWMRDGKFMSAPIVPHNVETEDPITMVKKNKFQIGASFLAIKAPFDMITVKADGFFSALSMGWHKSVNLSATIVNSFWDLLTGNVSVKAMGGPVMIGKIAGDSLKSGLTPFFKMMAFISLNLFIFNLLPLPVLDGGHLLLFGVEAIFRKPLPIKVIEIWTMAGFVFLMSLVVFVTFNDFTRLLK